MSLWWIALLVLVGIPSLVVLVAAGAFIAPLFGLLIVIAGAAVLFSELRNLGGRVRPRRGSGS